MSHGPAVAPGFWALTQGAISKVQSAYPGAELNSLQGSTSNPQGVTSPERLEKLLATFRTDEGTATIQGAANGVNSDFGPINFKAGIVLGAPSPLIWSSNGPAISADQADAMVKSLGVKTAYTALSLTSDDTPSTGPADTGAGWNHYLFTFLDGTAWVGFKGKNETSVKIFESNSSLTESQTESHSSQQLQSSETQSSEQF